MKLVLFAYHDIGCAALRTLYEMGGNVRKCNVFSISCVKEEKH